MYTINRLPSKILNFYSLDTEALVKDLSESVELMAELGQELVAGEGERRSDEKSRQHSDEELGHRSDEELGDPTTRVRKKSTWERRPSIWITDYER